MKRRQFVSFFGTALVALAALPRLVLAWPKAFSETSTDGVKAELFPGMEAKTSDLITLKAPAIAENGAVVPITVSTDLPEVTKIALVVNENPNPLAASFNLTPQSVPTVSTRLKMGKTTMVTALVSAGGQLYSVEQEVKVTIGGCGG
jgi:sulfur-oxidizing protein SoxY